MRAQTRFLAKLRCAGPCLWSTKVEGQVEPAGLDARAPRRPERTGEAVASTSRCRHLAQDPLGAEDPAEGRGPAARPSSCPATEGVRAAPSAAAPETLLVLSRGTRLAVRVNWSMLLFLDFLRGAIHTR